MQAHLVVDARPLRGSHNGIARVVAQVLKQLPHHTSARITAVSNREIVTTERDARIQWIEDKRWSRCPGNLWLSVRVPTLLRQLGATHFLGTQHLLPARKIKGVHYGVLMHDVVHLKFPQSMHWANRLASTLLFRRSYAMADSIVAISESTRADLCGCFWPRDIAVAYPGVVSLPPTAMAPEGATPRGVSDGPRRLLCVGSLEPRKNLPALLRAFDHMNRSGHVADLTFCSGAHWQSGPMLDFIRDYPGPGKIEILRAVSDAELARLYAQAHALVFPSLYEGFGLPLLEAVGHTAVIANDIPVFQEIGRHVEGIEFVDFSADPATTGRQLRSALERCGSLKLRPTVPPGTFTWADFTRKIVQNLGLKTNPTMRLS